MKRKKLDDEIKENSIFDGELEYDEENDFYQYVLLDQESKNIHVRFDKIFDRDDISQHNIYRIYKIRFYKFMDLIVDDMNIIFNNDDSDIAKEYLLFKIKISESIENNEEYSKEDFINDLEELCNDEVLHEIIDAYIEDTYDLKLNDIDGKKINIDLQVTDEINKIILKSAMCMRIVLPIICDYLCNKENINEDKIFFAIFRNIIKSFSDNTEYVLNKLFKIVKSRVYTRRYSDKVIWKFLQNLSVDMNLFVDELYESIISSIIVKIRPNTSSIQFIDVVLKKKIDSKFFIKYGLVCKPLRSMKSEKDSDERDRLNEMILLSSTDESNLILNRLTINDIINKYKKSSDVDIEWVKNDLLKGKNINEIQNYFMKIFYGNKFIFDIATEEQRRFLLANMIENFESDGLMELVKINSSTLADDNPTYIHSRISNKIKKSRNFISVLNKYVDVSDIIEKENFIKKICLFRNYSLLDIDNNPVTINENNYNEEVLRLLLK